jgi:hypothetical protein
MGQDGDINVLLRGQSNAQIFAGSGIYEVEHRLEAQLGVAVNILAEYGTDTSTIHSGTAFLDWDTDGQQASLIRYLEAQPADVRDNPTITVWMHNEYEQKGSASEGQWLTEVRADATLVRGVLDQSVETTPYVFVPVPYNYGQNWEWRKGMAALASDPWFNATMSDAFTGTVMDGDGYANSSHMGEGDVSLVAAALSRSLLPILSQLTGTPRPEVIPPPDISPQTPRSLVAGAGSDVLVLHVAQDAYQGNAQYSVRVDGQAFGETFVAGARHDAGLFDTLTLYGNWGTGSHDVEITLLNDAWGGTPNADRNLYVGTAIFNSVTIMDAARSIWDETSARFTFTAAGSSGPAPVSEAPGGISQTPMAPSRELDWDATSAAVVAHFNETGSWGIISDFYVFR